MCILCKIKEITDEIEELAIKQLEEKNKQQVAQLAAADCLLRAGAAVLEGDYDQAGQFVTDAYDMGIVAIENQCHRDLTSQSSDSLPN